jgi:hypothetical protein
MTTDLDRVIETYHRTRRQIKEIEASKILELLGRVPDDALASTLFFQVKEEHADLIEEHHNAAVAYEQAMAGLRQREVEAHERNSAFWTLQRERV